MDTTTNDNWVPHPGEFIKEEIDERGWSQRDLAFILGCPEQAINMLVSGKRGISPEMAKALGDAFGVPADLFSNLQRTFDLANARDPNPGIAKRARIQSEYPVREMIKRGWLEDTDAIMLEAQMARFFNVPNINDVPHLDHAAKKTNYDEVLSEQLAWLFRVKQIAKSISVTAKYSEKLLRNAVIKLKHLLVDPESIREIPRILSETGVRFILVESLPGSKIDGVCFWLNNESPVIGMSLQKDRIDNFWFVLRHEIEHVLCGHGKTKEIIDSDIFENIDKEINEDEQIANTAASDFCAPIKEMDSFVARKSPFFSEKDILAFAKIMQVHPGLVVGQLHARTKRYELFRKYLVKIRQFALQESIKDGWGEPFPVDI
ncbi:MAG: HigA family addiction module antitoxin [Nitrosomonas sp.]|nr:HigA family addiction module antitoxin [Nitrosomonas sp.]